MSEETLIAKTNPMEAKGLYGIKWERINPLVKATLADALSNSEKASSMTGLEMLKMQKEMKSLSNLLGEIVAFTDKKTKGLNAKEKPELIKLLEEAKEMGLIFNNPKGDYIFDETDRNNLVTNLEDLKKSKQVMLKYGMSKFENLLMQRTEHYKQAAMIEKTLSDAMKSPTRHISER